MYSREVFLKYRNGTGTASIIIFYYYLPTSFFIVDDASVQTSTTLSTLLMRVRAFLRACFSIEGDFILTSY